MYNKSLRKDMGNARRSEFIYTSSDVCERFQLSAPRLLQFRNGQSVKSSRKKNGKSVEFTYHFDPILTENVDFIWDGSVVMFSELALVKIENFKKNRKYHKRLKTEIIPPTKKEIEDELGLVSVKNISKELNIGVQEIYTMRDTVSGFRKKRSFQLLIQYEDWKYIVGKVYLTQKGIEKVKENIKTKESRKKIHLESNEKIIIIHKENAFTISGELAHKIAEMVNASTK